MRHALFRALLKAGKSNEDRIAIIAMTTNNSMSVNPPWSDLCRTSDRLAGRDFCSFIGIGGLSTWLWSTSLEFYEHHRLPPDGVFLPGRWRRKADQGFGGKFFEIPGHAARAHHIIAQFLC